VRQALQGMAGMMQGIQGMPNMGGMPNMPMGPGMRRSMPKNTCTCAAPPGSRGRVPSAIAFSMLRTPVPPLPCPGGGGTGCPVATVFRRRLWAAP
jgi:hypothetical protein